MADSVCHAPAIFSDIRNCFVFFLNINFKISQTNNFSEVIYSMFDPDLQGRLIRIMNELSLHLDC